LVQAQAVNQHPAAQVVKAAVVVHTPAAQQLQG
jgi:hypothetical protein